MNTVHVKLGKQSYRIVIEPGILEEIGERIKKIPLSARGVVITDNNVNQLYGDAIQKTLQQNEITPLFQIIPQGEDSKSYEQVTKIHTSLIENNIKRDDWILALGGGVVGDLAGFVAATYLRGIPFIQVPTTLLAQVDSSVGGKVGINHPLGKNLIGSFYQPRAVFVDPGVLATLNRREIWAGLGEVTKYGIITDPNLFDWVEYYLDSLVSLSDFELIGKIITRCCRAKAQIVEKDEKESGLRRIFNFGHTLGHALEAATDFQTFRHGEAIVYGMRWAIWVSLDLGILSKNEFQRIDTLLQRFIIPPLSDGLTVESVLSKIHLDKKQTQEGLTLVLVDNIGHTQFYKPKDVADLIKRWLDAIKK